MGRGNFRAPRDSTQRRPRSRVGRMKKSNWRVGLVGIQNRQRDSGWQRLIGNLEPLRSRSQKRDFDSRKYMSCSSHVLI